MLTSACEMRSRQSSQERAGNAVKHFMVNLLARVAGLRSLGCPRWGAHHPPADVCRGGACYVAQGDRPSRGSVPEGCIEVGLGRSPAILAFTVFHTVFHTVLRRQIWSNNLLGRPYEGGPQTKGCGSRLPGPVCCSLAGGSGVGRTARRVGFRASLPDVYCSRARPGTESIASGDPSTINYGISSINRMTT